MFKNQSNNLYNNAILSKDTHNDSLFDLPPNSNLPANSWHYPIRYLNRLLPFNGYHKTNKSSKTIKADKKSSVDSERHATMANPSKIASSKLDSFNTLTQKFSTQYFKRLTQTSITSQSLLFGLMDICQQFTTAAITNSPATLMADQLQLYQQQMQLFKNSLMTAIGAEKEPLVQPEKGDKRFNDKAWSDRVFFNHIKQSFYQPIAS